MRLDNFIISVMKMAGRVWGGGFPLQVMGSGGVTPENKFDMVIHEF